MAYTLVWHGLKSEALALADDVVRTLAGALLAGLGCALFTPCAKHNHVNRTLSHRRPPGNADVE